MKWGALSKLIQSIPTNDSYKMNERFKNFAPCFNDLTKTKNIATMYPIVSVMITYNSKLAVTVSKKDDSEYYVKMYHLGNFR